MFAWALTFLILAVIVALLSYSGIAGTAAGIARILFFVFLALFVFSSVMGALRSRVHRKQSDRPEADVRRRIDPN